MCLLHCWDLLVTKLAIYFELLSELMIKVIVCFVFAILLKVKVKYTHITISTGNCELNNTKVTFATLDDK